MLDQPGATISKAIGELYLGERLGVRIGLAQPELGWYGYFKKQVETHRGLRRAGAVPRKAVATPPGAIFSDSVDRNVTRHRQFRRRPRDPYR